MSEDREKGERKKLLKHPGSLIALPKPHTSTHHLPVINSLTSNLSLLKPSSNLLGITHSNFY